MWQLVIKKGVVFLVNEIYPDGLYSEEARSYVVKQKCFVSLWVLKSRKVIV